MGKGGSCGSPTSRDEDEASGDAREDVQDVLLPEAMVP